MLHRVNAAYASYSWWNIMLQIFSSSCLRTRMPWLHLRHQSCIMTRNPNLDLSKHLLHLSSILISYFLLQIGWIDGWMDGWIRLLMWQIGVVIKQTITNSLTSIEHSQHLLRTPIGNRANNGAHWMGLSVTGCLMQLVWWESFLCSPPGRQALSHPSTPCRGEHSQTSRAWAPPRAASNTQHPPLYMLVWYWTQD